MLIAIDTATAYASLALHDGRRVLAEHTWTAPRRHTVELPSRLATTMKQLNVPTERLSGVTVARGPGSFTGLRVGMSIAKGLSLSQNIPIIGVPTLDILVEALGQDARPLCAVLQAGRQRICTAIYRWWDGEWRVRQPPRLTTWRKLVDEIASPTLFCGEVDPAGIDVLSDLGDAAILLPAAARLRRAGHLAEIGWRRLKRGETDNPASLAPLYLQHPV